MSISDLVKTIILYSIVIVSFLSIFQNSSTIMNVLASSEDPDKISVEGLDKSYRMHDQKAGDVKNHFETGMEEINRDNWVFVNHDITGQGTVIKLRSTNLMWEI